MFEKELILVLERLDRIAIALETMIEIKQLELKLKK
jgi:hypothetical protein